MSNIITDTDQDVQSPKRRIATTDTKLPVTILTGFLGSGKTTCLNTFLHSSDAADTAVLINEFGEIDVDGAVLSADLADGSKLLTLPNGCICCAVQEDLAEALLALVTRAKNPEENIRRCIVETTGLADPGSIIRGIGHDPRLNAATMVAQTVTVCAADRLLEQLDRFEEVGRQVGIADCIVISKSDLVSPEAQSSVREAVAAINPLARVEAVAYGEIDPARIFGPVKGADYTLPEVPADKEGHHHHHTSAVETFTVRLDGPLEPGLFRDVMSFMIMRHAENLLRIKGLVLFSGEDQPRLLNGVHDVFSSEVTGPDTLAADQTGSIVFIGIDLPESVIRADLKSCELC